MAPSKKRRTGPPPAKETKPAKPFDLLEWMGTIAGQGLDLPEPNQVIRAPGLARRPHCFESDDSPFVRIIPVGDEAASDSVPASEPLSEKAVLDRGTLGSGPSEQIIMRAANRGPPPSLKDLAGNSVARLMQADLQELDPLHLDLYRGYLWKLLCVKYHRQKGVRWEAILALDLQDMAGPDPALAGLHRLSLRYHAGIPDVCWRALDGARWLTHLDLRLCGDLTNDCVPHINCLHHLRVLDISGTDVTTLGVRLLLANTVVTAGSGLVSLTHLNLSQLDLTPDVCGLFARFPRLAFLDLSFSGLYLRDINEQRLLEPLPAGAVATATGGWSLFANQEFTLFDTDWEKDSACALRFSRWNPPPDMDLPTVATLSDLSPDLSDSRVATGVHDAQWFKRNEPGFERCNPVQVSLLGLAPVPANSRSHDPQRTFRKQKKPALARRHLLGPAFNVISLKLWRVPPPTTSSAVLTKGLASQTKAPPVRIRKRSFMEAAQGTLSGEPPDPWKNVRRKLPKAVAVPQVSGESPHDEADTLLQSVLESLDTPVAPKPPPLLPMPSFPATPTQPTLAARLFSAKRQDPFPFPSPAGQGPGQGQSNPFAKPKTPGRPALGLFNKESRPGPAALRLPLAVTRKAEGSSPPCPAKSPGTAVFGSRAWLAARRAS